MGFFRDYSTVFCGVQAGVTRHDLCKEQRPQHGKRISEETKPQDNAPPRAVQKGKGMRLLMSLADRVLENCLRDQ